MTADYLLDAMGLIDDDLIRDAEVLPAPALLSSARRWTNRLSTLAACLVLVAALGYGISNLGMGGDSAAPSTSTGAMPSSSAVADSSCATSTPASAEPVSGGTIFLSTDRGTLTYALSGELVTQLPENCRSLGELALLKDGGQDSPATDGEAYAGCPLWAEGEEPVPVLLYVRLADGSYALAELVQP